MFCLDYSVSAWLWVAGWTRRQIGSALCADAAREEGRGFGDETKGMMMTGFQLQG